MGMIRRRIGRLIDPKGGRGRGVHPRVGFGGLDAV